jgi:rubrerythrin
VKSSQATSWHVFADNVFVAFSNQSRLHHHHTARMQGQHQHATVGEDYECSSCGKQMYRKDNQGSCQQHDVA